MVDTLNHHGENPGHTGLMRSALMAHVIRFGLPQVQRIRLARSTDFNCFFAIHCAILTTQCLVKLVLGSIYGKVGELIPTV